MSSYSNSLEPINYYRNIERFEKYKKITEYLKKIKLNSNACLTTYNNISYFLEESILLTHKIGSSSTFGVVYKAKNINNRYKDIPFFTVKIQLNTNSLNREIEFLSKLSSLGIKYKIPNLPILYKIIKCPYNSKFKLFEGISNTVVSNGYTMIINELASGDLKSFLNDKYSLDLTDELWRNIYEQLFISLVIIHSLGLVHNDAHNGNFLYHKIKKGGCFHYKINGDDYYIKNMGFLWTSWDYGKINKMKNKGSYIYDYMMVNLVTRKNDYKKRTVDYNKHEYYGNKEWGYLNSSTIVPPSIEKFQEKLWYLLGGTNHNNDIFIIRKRKMKEAQFLKFLLEKKLLFSKKPIGTIISSVNIKL